MLVLAVVTVLTLFAPATVRSEDTSIVMAALPNEAAEQRYLARLCERVMRAEKAWASAIDALADCYREGCGAIALQRADRVEDAAKTFGEFAYPNYASAADVYHAKRDKPPLPCAAASPQARSRMEAKMDAIAGILATMPRRTEPTPQQSPTPTASNATRGQQPHSHIRPPQVR